MNEIQNTESFEDRLMVKIRESIGDMMTKDELKTIVEKGINKAFFEPRLVKNGYRDDYDDPAIVKELRNLLGKRVEVLATQWFDDNPEKVEKILQEMIEKGIVQILSDALSASFSIPLLNLRNEIMGRINTTTM